ncbi:MAG: regulatory protein RecX [Actinobacteria bacterium]|nr:regulatory protein RecX [Actinomycetota bacterium]
MSIALFALAPRAKSRDELLKQLLKRGVESETANSVLDSLELQGLLNDLEFAKLWSESRQRAKKLSKRVIAGELRAKGVSQDIINEVIEAIDDEAEYRQAFLLAERKYNSISHLDPEVIYRRISGLLARKGYGHGVCAKIMRELSGRN